MKTIRTARLGGFDLRLVAKSNEFVGIVFSDGAIKVQIAGAVADDIWRRLHDEAAKANPRYFGFDGARARFLHFFEAGFDDERYVRKERDYKADANQR